MLHPASMVRRDILLQFPYDEKYSFGTDYVMNLEIAKAGYRLNHTQSYTPAKVPRWECNDNKRRRTTEHCKGTSKRISRRVG